MENPLFVVLRFVAGMPTHIATLRFAAEDWDKPPVHWKTYSDRRGDRLLEMLKRRRRAAGKNAKRPRAFLPKGSFLTTEFNAGGGVFVAIDIHTFVAAAIRWGLCGLMNNARIQRQFFNGLDDLLNYSGRSTHFVIDSQTFRRVASPLEANRYFASPENDRCVPIFFVKQLGELLEQDRLLHKLKEPLRP